MSDPVSHLKQELLAAAERQQGHAFPARKGRLRWLDRSDMRHGSRRRILVLAAAALVVAVGTAAAIGSVRDLILDRGFTGLPPKGATPSAPESGDLVVHWEGFTATLPPQRRRQDIVRAWVYADGRIIWDRRPHHRGPVRGIPEGANEFNSGYLEQRLTPEGVELVRSAVAELFDRSRTLLETFPAHDPWPGSKSRLALFVPEGSNVFGAVEVPDGDRLVRLRLSQACPPRTLAPRCVDFFEGTIATPEQLSALRRVDALLSNPASLLPARAADLLRGTSRTRRVGELQEAREGGRIVVLGQSVTYCFKVETEEAREVADAVSGLDPEPGWRGFGLAYRVDEGVRPTMEATTIWFEPYFPHGQFTFSGPFG